MTATFCPQTTPMIGTDLGHPAYVPWVERRKASNVWVDVIIVPHPSLPPSIPPSIHPSMWAYPIEPKITKRWLFCLLSPLLHSLSCAFHDQSERRRLQLFLHQIPSFAFSASSLVRPFTPFPNASGERKRERDWETKWNRRIRGMVGRGSDSYVKICEMREVFTFLHILHFTT